MAGRGKRLASLPPMVGGIDMRTARPAPKVADTFYSSPEWRALRAKLVKLRGRRCEKCGKTHEDDGSPVKLIGDHKVERQDGGAELDPANVELLCVAEGGDGKPHPDGKRGGCHNRKTLEARKARLWR